MTTTQTYDVIVVGSGNAGFCAAVSARQSGAHRVLLLEKSPLGWAGGNTTFTAGAYRTVFFSLKDVLSLLKNPLSADVVGRIDMRPYSEMDFREDLERVTGSKCDEELSQVLVGESNATTKWLAKNGVEFQLSFNRQAYEVGGRYKFWGGMVLSVVGGGKGLTRMHQQIAAREGVEVRYDSPVTEVLVDGGGGGVVTGTGAGDVSYDVLARGGVVLCAGGFEASSALRSRYLGESWSHAYVRGTPYNTGEVLEMAGSSLGAAPAGHWAGCHSTCWDANAPLHAGDQRLTNQFTKSGYPLGLMLNVDGDRFVDEGLDMRNYTYARFGREILGQPGGVAFQVWDAEGTKWLRNEEYGDEVVMRIVADTLEELAEELETNGLKDAKRFVSTVQEYNDAVAAYRRLNPDAKFDPSEKDGLSTRSTAGGLELDKTNWARPIATPPFLAVKVTCGVTFTFGGLKTDPHTAGVVSEETKQSIPGLYCAGEMLGGLFWENYPGGSGLTAGAVFGRIAGRSAAERAQCREGAGEG